MKTLILPWVDWGMGAVLIGVFALVVIVMVFIILGMMNSKKKGSDASEDNLK